MLSRFVIGRLLTGAPEVLAREIDARSHELGRAELEISRLDRALVAIEKSDLGADLAEVDAKLHVDRAAFERLVVELSADLSEVLRFVRRRSFERPAQCVGVSDETRGAFRDVPRRYR